MRLLFISYNHQEPIYADAIQNIRLIQELNKRAEVHICCRKHNGGNPERYEVYSPNLFLVSRILWKVFPFMRFMFDVDSFIWALFAYNRLKTRINDYDKIIVSYAPYSTWYLLEWLHKCTKKDIISLMYDPLVENCFFSGKPNAIRFRSWIERSIFGISKKCIVNNEKYYNRLIEKGYSDKLALVDLCGINYQFKMHRTPIDKNKLSISHAGSVYGTRRLKEIVDALDVLKSRNPELKDLLVINIYGRCSVEEKRRIVDSGLDDIIRFFDYCTQDVLSQRLENSDVLLLIDPLCEGNYSFPSKLCEYTQYEKLIIAISSPDSPSYAFLSKYGHKVFSKDETDKLIITIEKLLKNKKEFDSDFNRDVKKLFNPSYVCDRFMSCL